MPKFEEPKKDNRRRTGLPRKVGGDLLQDMTTAARSAVEEAESRVAPPRIVVTNCHTCAHPFRDWIELMLVKGFPYKTLGERVSPPVDRRSLSNHHKNHMDLQDAAFRHLLEREAEIEGRDFEEGVENIVTKRAVLEVALRKGYEDILNGITTVEPRDLVQISKVLAEMDTNQYQTGLDEARAAVQLFIQAIKNVTDPETQNLISMEVKRLRKREGVTAAVEHAMIDAPHDIEEAEVVEAEVVGT